MRTNKPRPPKPGRPLLNATPTRRINVTLDAETERGLRKLGRGNLSHAIRLAWQHIKKRK
jgi:hypothetical protein